MLYQFKKDDDNSQSVQNSQNKGTGSLISNMEQLSGYSLSDVNVHENSQEPQKVGALAFAQGTDVHLGPGQQEHLGHELAHVVQQKEGRVKPTLQMKGGIPLNDDEKLEKEADLMGGKAETLQLKTENENLEEVNSSDKNPVQMVGDQSGVQTDASYEGPNQSVGVSGEQHYLLVFNGRQYLLNAAEYGQISNQIISVMRSQIGVQIQSRAASARSLWNSFRDLNNDQYVVSWLVELTRGVELPNENIIIAAERASQRFQAAVNSGNLANVIRETPDAEREINLALDQMNHYRESMISGSENWVTGLEVTSTACFAIAGVVAGPALAPVLTSAGVSGLVAQGAIIGAGGSLLSAASTELGQEIAGTREDGSLWRMILAATTGGATGAMGPLINRLAGPVSKALVTRYGAAAFSGMSKEASEAFVRAILENSFNSAFGGIVSDGIGMITGNTEFSTFIRNIVINLVSGGIAGHITTRLPANQAEIFRRIAEGID